MIKNDEQFRKAFKKYKKYIRSKNAEVDEDYYPYACGSLECKDCVLNGVLHELNDVGYSICLKHPFQVIEKCEKAISVLKKEIEVIESWEKENDILTKEAHKKEEEKIYAEIQRLITKNGELTKEISRLYSKLDQMESGESNGSN